MTGDQWRRFEEYTKRVHSLSINAETRGIHSPTVLVRLARNRRKAIFPALRSLTVDTDFASDPAIFLIYSDSRVSSIELTVDRTPEPAIVSTAISALQNVDYLDSLSITYSEATSTPLRTLFSASLLMPLDLHTLSIPHHPVDYDYLVSLSRLPKLRHLTVTVVPVSGLDTDIDASVKGFQDLTTLDITASVHTMPRILRLIPRDALKKLHFRDTSWDSFSQRASVMQELHLQLASQSAIRDLRLTYSISQLSVDLYTSSRSVFLPLNKLGMVTSFSYTGDLVLDDETTNTFSSSWRNLKSLLIGTNHGISYTVLPALASRYHKLEILEMPVEFPASGTLDETEVLDHTLDTLIVSQPPGKCSPVVVARYLDRLFPYLSDISWKEVKDILVCLCQPVRCDQRGRSARRSMIASRILC